MIVVLADDLTGAASSATLLRRQGLDCRLVDLAHLNPGVGECDALVINTRTRDLDAHHVREQLQACVERILAWKRQPDQWVKRVDTTLRGRLRTELEVVLKRVPFRGGVVSPSFPEAQRVTHQGAVLVHDEPIGDLRDLITGLPQVRRIVVGRQFEFSEGSWWIPDVASPDDLSRVADSIIPIARELLVVDSGPLTAAMIQPSPRQRKVLVVLGSGAEQTQQQWRRLVGARRHGVEVLFRPLNAHDKEGLRVLVTSATQRLERGAYAGIVVGGGLTAEAVIDGLKCESLEPLGSPGPLLALTRVRGGQFDGLLAATKGGSVGDADTLIRLVDLIHMWHHVPEKGRRPR